MKTNTTKDIMHCCIFAISIIAIVIMRSTYNCNQSTDIEVYTNKNIYYINGTTVTNEMDSTVLKFDNRKSLKEYISNVTSNDLITK